MENSECFYMHHETQYTQQIIFKIYKVFKPANLNIKPSKHKIYVAVKLDQIITKIK